MNEIEKIIDMTESELSIFANVLNGAETFLCHAAEHGISLFSETVNQQSIRLSIRCHSNIESEQFAKSLIDQIELTHLFSRFSEPLQAYAESVAYYLSD